MYNKPRKPILYTVREAKPLMEYLMQQMNGISRNKVKSILSNRCVFVDDLSVTRFDYPLKVGQVVEISRRGGVKSVAPTEFEIVYEDDDIVVINKHTGILSMGKPGPNNAQTLLNSYFDETKQPCSAHSVHRLDRETSGLMLFAKSVEVKEELVNNWRELVLDRRYVALIQGALKPSEGVISSYLKDDKMFRTHSSQTDNGGKWAVTHYCTLLEGRAYSLLELNLETGRKNQIRVHLQDVGHPVVGDLKYGSTDTSLGRLGLHAYKLCFRHPMTGRELNFETPVPPSFEKKAGE